MSKPLSLTNIVNSYKTWVRSNPMVVTDMETYITWSSYFIAGKVNKSPIVSELVYSLSKLMSLYHDNVIREAYSSSVQSEKDKQEHLKMALTIIHYCQVLIELVVQKKWGNKGKWSVSVILQLTKCVTNLVLLYKFKEMPLQHPPIPNLQRKHIVESKQLDENANDSFKLKRSGRIIRKIDGAPSLAFRDWQPLKNNIPSPNSVINIKELIHAETIYIVKPIVHLLAMRLFGKRSWMQWLTSMSLDIISLRMYNKYFKTLSQHDRIEISRRKLFMILYLLRNPMYSLYTQHFIERTLKTTSKKVPYGDLLCEPILQYLNHWQDIYFYMWA